ncbi:13024_t:CDS:2 [Entrophospora sp. SA101]|nr:13024_t:CDS:2 [Entrophospora sp. SA101]
MTKFTNDYIVLLSFIIICYVRIISIKAQSPITIQLFDSIISNATIKSGQTIHYMYNVSQAGNVLLRNIRRDISTEKTSLETDNSQIVKNNLITNNIFITLTICKQPLSAENNTIPETLQIFYSNYSVPSADDSNSNPINWDYGFASKNLTNYEENVLYIGVFAPTFNAEFAGDYNFQIGVSSKVQLPHLLEDNKS